MARQRRVAGTIRKLRRTYQIRYTVDGKQKSKGGFATKADAERALAAILGDLAVGKGAPINERNVPRLGVLADPWLEKRKVTHGAGLEDFYRWRKHLAPHFDSLKPSEVTQAKIRLFVEAKLGEGLNPATIRVMIALLSSLFVDLIESGHASANPCRGLPKATMRLMKPTFDPKNTPFLERPEDIARVYEALAEPINVAFAIGALAGLRTGEVLALKWENVDLANRRILVCESIKGPVKDRESRSVPILDSLYPVLEAWKEQVEEAKGLVIPPMRKDGAHVRKDTPNKYLQRVLEALGLNRDGLDWYECTRHTFASQWVMAGGSIRTLKEIMGHYSIVVTERYAHLSPGLYTAEDLGRVSIQLGADKGSFKDRPRKVAV